MWQTWKTRNDRIFSGIIPWPPITISRAQIAHQQWNTCGPAPGRKVLYPSMLSTFHPLISPPPSTHDFEIHCDGSYFSDSARRRLKVSL
ncbi:unnamed protein product [Linum trigynum]|uniref:Uncharacterized protein n=1 Tax=Linum trigynum TaxID=586398 RepID=A0AAV2C921_9ROSI